MASSWTPLRIGAIVLIILGLSWVLYGAVGVASQQCGVYGNPCTSSSDVTNFYYIPGAVILIIGIALLVLSLRKKS